MKILNLYAGIVNITSTGVRSTDTTPVNKYGILYET